MPPPEKRTELVIDAIFEDFKLYPTKQKEKIYKEMIKQKEKIYKEILEGSCREYAYSHIIMEKFKFRVCMDCERECYELTYPSFFVFDQVDIFLLLLEIDTFRKKYKILDKNIFSIIQKYIR
jgi:hypothetical protein